MADGDAAQALRDSLAGARGDGLLLLELDKEQYGILRKVSCCGGSGLGCRVLWSRHCRSRHIGGDSCATVLHHHFPSL